MATAISSALSKIPVRRDIAMTGEITLRGKVLPIGGLKEKLLAALRAGIKEAIIPKENEKDLADVPENIRGQMKVHFVENMDQVLKVALETPLPDFPEEGAQTSLRQPCNRRYLANAICNYCSLAPTPPECFRRDELVPGNRLSIGATGISCLQKGLPVDLYYFRLGEQDASGPKK